MTVKSNFDSGMVFREHLFLGPVCFSVESSKPLYSFVADEDLYAPFRTPAANCPQRHVCRVQLTEEPLAIPTDAALVFDASPAWRLWADAEGGRWIQRTSAIEGSFEQPLWLAHADRSGSQVLVHPSEALEREGVQGAGWANPTGASSMNRPPWKPPSTIARSCSSVNRRQIRI